jgi:hypothetical protein
VVNPGEVILSHPETEEVSNMAQAFTHEVPYVENVVNAAIKDGIEGEIVISKLDRLWVVGVSTCGSRPNELVLRDGMVHMLEYISEFAVEQQRFELKYEGNKYIG